MRIYSPAAYSFVTLKSGYVVPQGFSANAILDGWSADFSGNGYLAGEYPSGTSTVDGVPVAATVRVLYRPIEGIPTDGVLVALTQSAPDGTWRVDGLDPALKFDVVGRKSGFNDVIMANVSPKVV